MVNFGLDQRQHAAGYTCNWTVHLQILKKAGGRADFDGIMEISWEVLGVAWQTLARKSFRWMAQLTGNSEG